MSVNCIKTIVCMYDSGHPCGDVHRTDSRLSQGERSLKTYFPNSVRTFANMRMRAPCALTDGGGLLLKEQLRLQSYLLPVTALVPLVGRLEILF